MTYEPFEKGGSKLTVGPNIKLKGVEITDCDTLVVEGRMEATLDSRVLDYHRALRGRFDSTTCTTFQRASPRCSRTS